MRDVCRGGVLRGQRAESLRQHPVHTHHVRLGGIRLRNRFRWLLEDPVVWNVRGKRVVRRRGEAEQVRM